MTKHTEEKAQPEALATFAAAARNKGVKPASQGATPETSAKPGNLAAEEKTRRISSAPMRQGTKSALMRPSLTTQRPISVPGSQTPVALMALLVTLSSA